MTNGQTEEPSFGIFAGITIIPIISFIFSLLIIGPILIFWAVPSIVEWCVVYGVVAIFGVKGALLENKIIKETDKNFLDKTGKNKKAEIIRQKCIKMCASIWIMGVVVANFVK